MNSIDPSQGVKIAFMTRHQATARSAALPTMMLVIGLVALALPGCNRNTDGVLESATQPRSKADLSHRPQGSPKETLRMVFQRYRNADSYTDRGSVELTFRADGKIESRTAPLRVSFHQGELDVTAYSIRITHDSQRGMAWFSDPVGREWADQVLLTQSTGRRPNLNRLLADPVLNAQLSAGGAGPPPQLEWLFSANPMEKLFDGAAQFAWGDARSIGDSACHSIEVSDTNDRFTFWIDFSSSLIRRIDLPNVVLPMAAQSGVLADREIELTLHLAEASFVALKNNAGSTPLPPSPRWVRKLVPPPNRQPSWTRWRTDDFKLTDTSGRRLSQIIRDHDSVRYRLLVGLPSLNDAAPMVEFLNRWTEQMPAKLRDEIQMAIVLPNQSDLQVAARSKTFGDVPLFANTLADSRESKFGPTSIAVVEQNTIAWMQPGLDAQNLPLLGSVLADMANGINVRQRVLDQAADARRQFRAAVDDVSIHD